MIDIPGAMTMFHKNVALEYAIIHRSIPSANLDATITACPEFN
jgi:hypothetical protein